MMFTIAPCLFLGACDERMFESSERFQSDFHFSYALPPGGRLEVENFNGPVEITGWDEPRCEISGIKFASTTEMRDRIKIDVNKTGSLVYARSVRPAGDFRGNMGVQYVIHVPRKVELSRIASSNGGIHVEDIEGRAELNTTNGQVRVHSLTGALTVHTSNGGITVENIAGAVAARTSNGAIRAEHVMAGMEAATSNGSITVDFDENGPTTTTPLKFETNNGKIDITVPTSPKSDIRAHTSNSSITLRMPANASAKVRMETTHGQVRSDFQADGARAERHGRGQNLEETIGSGGPFIDLETSNGSIHLLKL